MKTNNNRVRITRHLPMVFILLGMGVRAQSNTAVSSGSIGKCAVWNYPAILYNNSGASQTVSDGITVTVDQNRNIGAVVLSGSGTLVMSGSNGITLSGNGGDINCRWDIGSYGSHTVINNNGDTSGNYSENYGVFFTAPYSGTYYWLKGNGTWGANMSGAFLNGGFGIVKSSGPDERIFYQSESGTCGLTGVASPPIWKDVSKPIPLGSGQTMSYGAGTVYDSRPACNNSTLNLSIGNAVVIFDN